MLAIPESCVDNITTLYHSHLFAGHQGVIKTYLTISNFFFHAQPNPLFMILYQGLPYMPII